MKSIYQNLLFAACILFLAFNVTGCAIQQPRPAKIENVQRATVQEAIQKEKTGYRKELPPPEEITEPAEVDVISKTSRYSMVFNNAPLSQVLDAVTTNTDFNLSIERGIDLSRPVTIRLKDVSFKEAMDMIVEKGAGYAWSFKDNSIYIKEFEEHIYHFDYLDIAGETEIEVGGDMLASGVEDSGVSGKYQMKSSRKKETTDVWAGIETALNEIKSENGSVRINRNAGIIYMMDYPNRIDGMVSFLDALLNALNRQVYIEARILEVQLSENNQYGIDWSDFTVAFKNPPGSFPDQFALNVNSGGAIVLSGQSAFGGVLDYLQTQGDVSVISNPHISVMNGKSAILTVGIQFPYGDIEGVTRNEDTDTTTIDASIKRAILGLQLGITPQISQNGMVTLNIVPTITRIQTEERVELPTSTGAQSINNPVIELQELSTTVRVQEGNSIVLAGLISQIKNKNAQGLPVLSKIPFLGALFNHMEDVLESRELVIFITPYVKEVI